jgi:hypothetical protein
VGPCSTRLFPGAAGAAADTGPSCKLVADEDDQHRLTIVLRKLSPTWAWVRANFTLPAVLTILGILGAAAAYIITLRTRVTVLETEVTHIVTIAPDQAKLAGLEQRVDDHEGRIKRMEGYFDRAQTELDKAKPDPVPPRRKVR